MFRRVPTAIQHLKQSIADDNIPVYTYAKHVPVWHTLNLGNALSSAPLAAA